MWNRSIGNMGIILLATTMPLFISCDKEDDPSPAGNLTILPSQSSYAGPRGTDVGISLEVVAEDGIASIIATPEGQTGQTVNVPAGTVNMTLDLTFTVPADALLGTIYTIDVEVTDTDGDRSETIVEVTTSPLIGTAPDTYTFDRNGNSSVSYSGQNDRLDMVEEMKVYMVEGDRGAAVSAQVLQDAYANAGGNGNGFFSFTSDRQLRDKTFQPDLDAGFMENLFIAMEAASNSNAEATAGTAGRLVRENSGNTILVDERGREFTQLIEKGLMGTVMYHQIFNVYFSEGRVGDNVENTMLRDGSNYTDMEHHWDEAFGYFNPPIDFSSNWPADRGSEDRFWSHYSNVVDPFLGTNDRIMEGFISGRTAIVNNDMDTKNAMRIQVADELELVAAATTVHYINSTLGYLNEGKIGEAFHTLSEAWAFVNAIKYYPDRKLTLDAISNMQEEQFGSGGNFWNVTPSGLNEAKAVLANAYPSLQTSLDEL